MTFKTILAILETEAAAERTLDCAIALAERCEAHLVGLHAEALPIAFATTEGFVDTGLMEAVAKRGRERSAVLESVFRSRAAGTGLSHEWHALESFTGDAALSGIADARSADLVVISAGSESEGRNADLDALLFEAGRPVLVMPADGPALGGWSKVLVAWNGSREAARAAFDALPFIVEADATEILLVDPPADKGEAPGAAIAAALARHGAAVSVHEQESGSQSTDAVIRDRVLATGADLLVMGAYSHSWLRELLFGGTTRSLLGNVPAAVLLSR